MHKVLLVVLLVQKVHVLLMLLVLLLLVEQLLLVLAEVEVEGTVHAEFMLDDLVHVAVKTAVKRVQVEVKVVGHWSVVIQGPH